MREGTNSLRQVIFGVGLGILLLPFPLILEAQYYKGEMAGLNVLFHAVLFFGVVQAFAILPAALCFFLAGKHGIVRGLLYFGTFTAVCNVLLWVFRFRGFFNPPIY